MPRMQDGRYTLVYPSGDYRTVQIKTMSRGNLKGRTIFRIKEGKDFTGVGFWIHASDDRLDGRLAFWSRFRESNPPERLQRIQKAVERLLRDPEAAGFAYAMQEKRCYRCGKELTVPASIHRGLGPECAKRVIRRKDNQEAYKWRAGQKPAPEKLAAPEADSQDVCVHCKQQVVWTSGRAYRGWVHVPSGDHLCSDRKNTASIQLSLDKEWIEQKNKFAEEEKRQEEEAFMSDPDMQEVTKRELGKQQRVSRFKERPDLSDFDNAPCLRCGVPRYRCSC